MLRHHSHTHIKPTGERHNNGGDRFSAVTFGLCVQSITHSAQFSCQGKHFIMTSLHRQQHVSRTCLRTTHARNNIMILSGQTFNHFLHPLCEALPPLFRGDFVNHHHSTHFRSCHLRSYHLRSCRLRQLVDHHCPL